MNCTDFCDIYSENFLGFGEWWDVGGIWRTREGDKFLECKEHAKRTDQ